MEAAVVSFNRDLRLSDHLALDAAVTTAKRIVPLFVLDDTILQRGGAQSRPVLARLPARFPRRPS
jgi:deoxyribodipyrimidine photo-lyase